MSFGMRMHPHPLRSRPHLSPITLAVALLIATSGSAAEAKVVVVDPAVPPEVTLPAAEAERLSTLQGAGFVPLETEVSPDDAVVGTSTPDGARGFLDLRTGAVTPVNPDVFGYSPFTDFRWRDSQTLVFIGGDRTGATFVVSVNRSTGAVQAAPLVLPGFPVSLSAQGSKLLLVLRPEPPAPGPVGPAARSLAPLSIQAPAAAAPVDPTNSPFDLELKPSPWKRVGPAIFDADTIHSTRIASAAIQLVVLDIASGAQQTLLDLPPNSGLLNIAWSADDRRLALVRWQFPDNSRGGQVGLEDASTQDGLGHLRPRDNPFLSSNVLDLFTLDRGAAPQHTTLRRPLGDEPAPPIFAAAFFSPDRSTVMTQLWWPGTPQGHRYPSYANPNRSSFAFYDGRGRLSGTLAEPEIAAPQSNVPMFLSSDEVVFDAASGPSWGLFHYNRKSKTLRQLRVPEGAIYQVRPTHFSRELVFNHGSFLSPYEIYRVGVHDRAPVALTHVNAKAAAANQVRVDKVDFDLACGTRRTGYLVQPAAAPFPPRDARLVVWQQGGPTAPMTNDWSAAVEQPFNLLPNFGFAVLMVPLPGREGFGPAFLDGLADGRNFGQVDIDEQVEIVKQLQDRGYTSSARVGITGCSYGGYFTSESITSHPGVYAAANMQCSLLDLVDEWQTGFKPYISFLEGRTPIDQLREYQRDSPSFNASRVRTPVLIFDGTEDFLPYTLSQNFHDAVNAAGTPSDFLLFSGEGHGLRAPSSEFVAGQAQINWFRRYLARRHGE